MERRHEGGWDGWMDERALRPSLFLLLPLTFPMASRPLSKKNMTPRTVKRTPKPVRPTPISVVVVRRREGGGLREGRLRGGGANGCPFYGARAHAGGKHTAPCACPVKPRTPPVVHHWFREPPGGASVGGVGCGGECAPMADEKKSDKESGVAEACVFVCVLKGSCVCGADDGGGAAARCRYGGPCAFAQAFDAAERERPSANGL